MQGLTVHSHYEHTPLGTEAFVEPGPINQELLLTPQTHGWANQIGIDDDWDYYRVQYAYPHPVAFADHVYVLTYPGMAVLQSGLRDRAI
jgi:hypothetical protein